MQAWRWLHPMLLLNMLAAARRLFHNIVSHVNQASMPTICKHGKQRHFCMECGGSSICQHGKQKYKCPDCKGSSICEHRRQRGQCKDCKPMAVLSGKAAAAPRLYYSDRRPEDYVVLDEYAVAEGCDESEVMAQLSFGEQGDILFDDIYDTSFVDRKLVPYAPLIICCVAFKLILRR